MKSLDVIFALLKLAPQVIQLVGEVQAAMGDAPGTVKKAVVMAPLAGAPPEIASALSGFVDLVVTAKKSIPAVVAGDSVIDALKTSPVGLAIEELAK